MRIYRAAYIPALNGNGEVKLTDYEHRHLPNSELLKIAKDCIDVAGINIDIDDIVIDDWIDNGQY
jgi:hypothetical protein